MCDRGAEVLLRIYAVTLCKVVSNWHFNLIFFLCPVPLSFPVLKHSLAISNTLLCLKLPLLLPNPQRMGPGSRCLRRCLWVGSCGVPPPRPPTSWPSTLGRGAHRCAQAWMARSSSPKIMFVCTLQSPCPASRSTTQVRRERCSKCGSCCISVWCEWSELTAQTRFFFF